jgi:hypothetical protein
MAAPTAAARANDARDVPLNCFFDALFMTFSSRCDNTLAVVRANDVNELSDLLTAALQQDRFTFQMDSSVAPQADLTDKYR